MGKGEEVEVGLTYKAFRQALNLNIMASEKGGESAPYSPQGIGNGGGKRKQT